MGARRRVLGEESRIRCARPRPRPRASLKGGRPLVICLCSVTKESLLEGTLPL